MTTAPDTSLLDDIGKFFKDLIMGDFEEDQGTAAMIVGGAISLIPVVDQIMDVRDVSGMIYRIGKKGVGNATKDDWIDMALAAFGCIPEVGSLFKTIVKPIKKLRNESKLLGHLPSSALVESMLGKGKGAAIKFFKTFQWAANTQQAITLTMDALDNCVDLLTILSEPHWWLPEDIQYLARDMKPRVEQVRGPLKAGIQEGSAALQELIKDMLGEDALWVAQKVTYAAAVVGNTGAKHNDKPAAAASHIAPAPAPKHHTEAPAAKAKPAEPVSPGKGKTHEKVADSNRQTTQADTGHTSHARRTAKELLSDITFIPRGLVGEHMADYYHMEQKLNAKGAWPHGNVKGKWKSAFPRIVAPNNKDERPSELVPEDLAKVTLAGVDTIWQTDATTYHFIEAKTSESAGSMYGMGQKKMRQGSIPTAPATLNDRQLALWSLLGEPKKGTQMGRDWIRGSTSKEEMRDAKNLKNRWVYLFLIIPSVSNPFGKMAKSPKGLHLLPAPGTLEHLQGVIDILKSGNPYKVELHDVHKPTHDVSETFTWDEIDTVVDRRKLAPTQKKKTASSGSEDNSDGEGAKKPKPGGAPKKLPKTKK
ncbi:hypothetical protein [Undibacterium sp.]|uniref:hypothetical protein n=1 Tax=Undibacterium sp. TaxID=1914977 RepID=UPI00374C9BBD